MNTITLYTSQSREIVQRLRDGQPHVVKMQYVRQKYGEVAHVFIDAYTWYTRHAEQIVPRPDEAESAVWAFYDLHNLERHADSTILQLAVPLDQAVFFRMSDWSKVLNTRYIGHSAAEEHTFSDKLAQQGIGYEGDVYRKPFYPLLKRELVASWQNLFRLHDGIRDAFTRGEVPDVADIQAGLWLVRPEWVVAEA